MSDALEPLSSTGLRRREEILTLALRASRRRRNRRMAVRYTLGCGIVGAVALSVLFHATHRAPPSQSVHVQPADPHPPAVTTRNTIPGPTPTPHRAKREIVITHIAPTGSVERINDDQLLEQLALAHSPAGLARVKGKTILLYRHSPQ